MVWLYILFASFVWWQLLVITTLSSGFHRYFSHQAFKAPVWYEYLVLSLGPLAGTGSLLGWAAVHRLHHAKSDTEDDPHSPVYLGYWNVLVSRLKIRRISKKYYLDLIQNPRVAWFHKHHYGIRLLTFLLGALLLPWPVFLAFIVLPIFWGYLSFGVVNTVGHWYGKPRNSFLANVFLPGEGDHLVHHRHPNWYHITKAWDPTARFIDLIATSKDAS